MKSTNMSLFSSIAELDRQALLRHFPSGVVALDLETTGLSPLNDSILELSAIKLTSEGEEKIFDQLINPERQIPPSVISIHGINDLMVENAPKISEVLPSFWEFCKNLPLIAHNAKFDLGFLIFQGQKTGHQALGSNPVYCSCQFSRNVFPHFDQHKLSYLAKKLGIVLKNHHRALDDAMASIGIFAEGLKKLSEDKMPLHKSLIFNVQDFRDKQNIKLPDELSILQEAISTQATIEIEYDGGSFKKKFRPVRPSAIIPMPKGPMLYAHCLLSDQYKSFAIKKVLKARYP